MAAESKSSAVEARSRDRNAADAVGIAARAAALELFGAGLAQRGGFDSALTRSPFVDLPPRERAFARALAATAFRRLGAIDRALDQRLQRAPPEPVRNLLRLGAAQILFMDTAAHAAVSTTVTLAASRPDARAFKGLVNAVLRAVAAAPPAEASPIDYAPPWLFARWRAAFGQAAAEAIAACIAEEPPTDLTPRSAEDAPSLAEALGGQALAGGTVRTWRRGEISDWPGFAEGRWWVQDASAAIPARLLDLRPGESVLDLCAAPGGKTLQLAAAGATVTAVDRSAPRLKRLRQNLARTGLSAEAVAADAAAWDDPRRFDAVLLDAPCTATGTFRRHPDVLWASRPADLAKLAPLQARLFDAAADRVRPGGRLVYCVCSLETEEGEDQVAAFLRRRDDFWLAPITEGEGGSPTAASLADGTLRLLPGLAPPLGGLDGFFIARFVRRATA